jgi:hypothetical protein
MHAAGANLPHPPPSIQSPPPPKQKQQISLEPLGHWQLCSTLQAAVGAALAARGWLLLGEGAAIEADLVNAPPGAQGTAATLEFEVGVQEPDAMLLFVRRAGAARYRHFSIAHALSQERPPLPAPLQPGDDDGAVVRDPAKLAAAAKLLAGRPVKLLGPPAGGQDGNDSDGPVFITGIAAPASVPPAQAAALRAHWLAARGLALPPAVPYYVAVSRSQCDPDAPSVLVPCCCVLTALGVAPVAAGAAGGVARGEALARALRVLTEDGNLAWGPAGLHRATAAAGGGGGAGGAAAAAAPKASNASAVGAGEFAYSATWAPASDLPGGATGQPAASVAAGARPPSQLQATAVAQTAAAATAAAAGKLALTTASSVLLVNMRARTDGEADAYVRGDQSHRRGGFEAGSAGWRAAHAPEEHHQQQQQGAEDPRGGDWACSAAAEVDGCEGAGRPGGDGGDEVFCREGGGEGPDGSDPRSGGPGLPPPGRRAPRQSKVSADDLAALKAYLAKRQQLEDEEAAAAGGGAAGVAASRGAAAAAAVAAPRPAGGRQAGVLGVPAAKKPPLAPRAAGGSVKRPALGGAAAPGAAGPGEAAKPPAPKRAKKAGGAAAAASKPTAAQQAGDTAPLQQPAAAIDATTIDPSQLNTQPDPQQPAAAAAAAAATAVAPPPPDAEAAAEGAAAGAAKKNARAPGPDAGAALAKVTAALAAAITAAGGATAVVAAGGAVLLKGVTGPELQCYMRHHKLTVGGKKGDLEARALQHYLGGGAAGGSGG